MFDMDWSPDDETDTMLWHMAIQNAIEYSGKAAPGSVIGRLMSIRQDLRQYGKVLSPLIAQKVAQANKLASDEGLDYLRGILENEAPELLEERENKSSEKDYLNYQMLSKEKLCCALHLIQMDRYHLAMQEVLSSMENMQENMMVN